MNFSLLSRKTLVLPLGCALALMASTVSITPGWAQDASASTAQVSGEEILREVRLSRALQNYQALTGVMRNDRGKVRIPIEFSMSGPLIRFKMQAPAEELLLDLGEKGTTLKRVANGSTSVLPVANYGTNIRDTAANYEDLSMRFLYWSNPRIMGEDTVTYMKCWIVRVTNPDARGPYGTVDVWVHKESKAVVQMFAYNRLGKKMKAFVVRKGQKFEGAYILKQMRIEQIDPETQKVVGRTYLEIDDPK